MAESRTTRRSKRAGRGQSHIEPRTEPRTEMPRHAIKMRKIGATWWGQKWIEALERMSRDYLNRLGRGRSDARAGRVHDLRIATGTVSARVAGSDGEVYDVTLRVAMLPPPSWKKTIEAMSQQAVFAAELLSGQMPQEIEQAFRAAGHSLFPLKQREIETDCSCPDWANPCKHVAAVHYVLGEAFDKDPFLLFELRGRTRQQVLGALSALRSGEPDDRMAARVARAAAGRAKPKTSVPVLDLRKRNPEEFERRSTQPHLQFSIDPPTVGHGLLSQLGAPPSWPQDDLPFDDLAALYRAAGQLACELALDSPRAGSPRAEMPAGRVRAKLKGKSVNETGGSTSGRST